MGKKFTLPLLADPDAAAPEAGSASKKPSIDAARTRLGGRVQGSSSEAEPPPGFSPGAVVAFAVAAGSARRIESDPAQKIGVVLFASSVEVHVLLDGIRLRRAAPQDLEPFAGGASIELEKIAADARMFGHLAEGQSVRYADEAGNLIDGKVVEKCRWGALVLRDDGAVVAVGFRKLWPSTSHGAA